MINYLVVKFTDLTQEQSDILTAMLPEYGFQGMEEFENSLTAYSSEFESDLDILLKDIGLDNLHYQQSQIPEENWNAQWESNFEPVMIPEKIHVRAHFHPQLSGFEHEITITPKMSFGTGHHATTSMMMKAMLDISFTGKTVLDFGTGTGILAILAAKMGSGSVKAIDNDEWSINNAIENAQLNGVTAEIDIKLAADLVQVQVSDIVLANINKHVLIGHVNEIIRVLNKNGFLILSGLLISDYDDIMKTYSPLLGTTVRELRENGWLCLVFNHNKNS